MAERLSVSPMIWTRQRYGLGAAGAEGADGRAGAEAAGGAAGAAGSRVDCQRAMRHAPASFT